MGSEGTLYFKRLDHDDPRLGRHVLHDSRSRRFPARTSDPRKLASVRHAVAIPIMDQLNVGSCTGHAGTANLGDERLWPTSKGAIGPGDPHVYAVHLYSAATAIDPWTGQYLPDDTGSDGLSIAKVLKDRGLISGYQHAFSLNATLTALAQGVVMIGSSWLSGMFDPLSDGQILVKGNAEGGHEYALDELDVGLERVWLRNSWGPGWGQGGRAWVSWDDLGTLLADDGDCTILVPRNDPPPQPVPIPVPLPTADHDLAIALAKFVKAKSCPAYVRKPATEWLHKT